MLAIERESLLGHKEGRSPRVAVTDDLHLNVLSDEGMEYLLNEVFVHPRFHLAHPKSLGSFVGGGHGGLVEGRVLGAVLLVSSGRGVGKVRHRDLEVDR